MYWTQVVVISTSIDNRIGFLFNKKERDLADSCYISLFFPLQSSFVVEKKKKMTTMILSRMLSCHVFVFEELPSFLFYPFISYLLLCSFEYHNCIFSIQMKNMRSSRSNLTRKKPMEIYRSATFEDASSNNNNDQASIIENIYRTAW
jgi:hypothetical protein